MIWYHYVACFFAGIFLANAVPHFVKGICGDRFPTPFAKPPGKGLSSPLVNVLWALVNPHRLRPRPSRPIDQRQPGISDLLRRRSRPEHHLQPVIRQQTCRVIPNRKRTLPLPNPTQLPLKRLFRVRSADRTFAPMN